MGVVAEIERELVERRCREQADDTPELRTSTMTHVAWAPPRWLAAAHTVLAGLDERHPARTIILVPESGGGKGVSAKVDVRDFPLGNGREVLSEVIELALRGPAARHPASLVLPLLIPDLPAFCRWRGEPRWDGEAFADLIGVCDRLVVDSAEWRSPAASYGRLTQRFDDIVVSDLAWRRGARWRTALAARWPGIGEIERLRVEGPLADTQLLAGWLRSRLKRPIRLSRRNAAELAAVRVDGDPVQPPGGPAESASELLSAELDCLGRDSVYEAAVRAV